MARSRVPYVALSSSPPRCVAVYESRTRACFTTHAHLRTHVNARRSTHAHAHAHAHARTHASRCVVRAADVRRQTSSSRPAGDWTVVARSRPCFCVSVFAFSPARVRSIDRSNRSIEIDRSISECGFGRLSPNSPKQKQLRTVGGGRRVRRRRRRRRRRGCGCG